MKPKMIAVPAILFTMAFAVALCLSGLARAETRLTENAFEDAFPAMGGNYLVWQGKADGDWEIFVYDLAAAVSPVRITNNNYGDFSPQTDGNYVAWVGYKPTPNLPAGLLPHGGEIFLYDLTAGYWIQITDDTNQDEPPQIANGRVVWISHEVADSVGPGDIFAYDTRNPGVISQITVNAGDIGTPNLTDDEVAWIEPDPLDPRKNLIYVYNFNTNMTSQVPEYTWNDPQTDGSVTVGARHDGNDREIFVGDRSLGREEQVTNNGIEDRDPRIRGKNIAWVGGEGPDSEIYITVYDPVSLITADISVHPKNLNLASQGQWITVHIELPSGYDVAEIDITTIRLEGIIPAETEPAVIGDYDEDGALDLMVKFDRQNLISLLEPGDSKLRVEGKLADGTMFAGTDTITVGIDAARARNKGKGKK